MSFNEKFLEKTAKSVRLVCDRELIDGVAEAGLLEVERFEALLSSETGSHGRGVTTPLTLPGRSERFYLRPVLHGGILGPLLDSASWGLARPLQELRVTSELHSKGAPVPRPAFVIGRPTFGPIWKSAIATFAINDGVDGLEFFRGKPSTERIERALHAAAIAIRKFHDCGGQHADLHVKNLLVCENEGTTRVCVIDLDRASLADPVFPARRMQELMRLYRSLIKRDLLQFLSKRQERDFFATYIDKDAKLRHAMLSNLERERARVAVHALGYRRPSK